MPEYVPACYFMNTNFFEYWLMIALIKKILFSKYIKVRLLKYMYINMKKKKDNRNLINKKI